MDYTFALNAKNIESLHEIIHDVLLINEIKTTLYEIVHFQQRWYKSETIISKISQISRQSWVCICHINIGKSRRH